MLRNVGDARFVDVTDQVGLGDRPGENSFSWTSAWSDIDRDGDLDLFVARWGIRAPGVEGILATKRSDSRLFLWNGEHFEDATERLGIGPFVSDAAILGAAFGDADGDGDPDLFLSSPTRRGSVLLRNEGGSFALQQRFDTGFGVAFVDFDHDGQLEILQAGLAGARTSVQAAVYGRRIGAPTTGRTRLFRRLADGSWSDVEDFLEGELAIGTMGSSYGDLDNDGCYEVYLGTGGPEPWFQLPNLLYLGRREGAKCQLRADNASMMQSFGSIQKGHGVVFFDFDGDGDQDVISSLGGMWPGDRWPNQLFVNESPAVGSWLELRLRGRQSNRHGLGAAIRVVAQRPDGGEVVRTATIDGKTGFGSGPLVARFGLGDATSVESVEVRWPVSDCRASYRVEIDARTVLDEDVCRAVSGTQSPTSGAGT
ncbi:MAG: CRTAC1 family protein [Thermoanaerobaculia bacterium]|nr:CRTAC1 family protein [Thermoanaerobaculia bacterium]